MKKVIFIILSFLSISALSDWSIEKVKIDYLLEQVKVSNGTFIRNGSEHTSIEAAKHLENKLDSALNSWFTPKKEKWTAELFIEKVASHSSFSGKVYKIRLLDGQTVETSIWLHQTLKKFDKSNQKSKK